MNRAQTYQVPKGKTKNGIVPVPIIVNGTNTHNSGDVAKQGSVRANLLGIIPFAKKLFSKKKRPAPAPRKPNPEGELVISFYDSTKELLSTEILSLKSENEWETLSFSTKAEEKGFVSASIRGTSSEPAKFDDFSIQLKSLYSAKLYQENHYYPFGMNMKGLENEDFQTVQNKDEHLWQYNGKERQDDFDLFWLDYGARNYDSQLGRFHTVDRFSEKYYSLTAYQYAANNPISNIDINGDSVWVTTKVNTETFENGITSTTISHTIHVTGKILDLEGGNDVANYAKSVNEAFNSIKESDYTKNGNSEITVNYSFDVKFEAASSMDDVKDSDHLLVITDGITGESAKGGEAGGLASIGGKIAYVKGDNVQTGVHEVGHNLGLIHTFEDTPAYNDPSNYMDYTNVANSFNSKQLRSIVIGAKNGKLNQGSNSQTYNGPDTNNWFFHTSTNEAPYLKNVTKGTKIPKTLKND